MFVRDVLLWPCDPRNGDGPCPCSREAMSIIASLQMMAQWAMGSCLAGSESVLRVYTQDATLPCSLINAFKACLPMPDESAQAAGPLSGA